MILNDLRARERPDLILTDMIAVHGARRMLVAFLRALVRQNRAPPALGLRLSPHLMRDIGLDPVPDLPRPAKIGR